jgi:hypothetical protein
MRHSKELYMSYRFAGEHRGISHLLFASNTLLFMEAKEDHATMIRSILRRY